MVRMGKRILCQKGLPDRKKERKEVVEMRWVGGL